MYQETICQIKNIYNTFFLSYHYRYGLQTFFVKSRINDLHMYSVTYTTMLIYIYNRYKPLYVIYIVNLISNANIRIQINKINKRHV